MKSRNKTIVDMCVELMGEKRITAQGKSKTFNIKKLRASYGLTQDELAAVLRVTPATVKSWEQGIRKPKGPATIVLEAMVRSAKKIK